MQDITENNKYYIPDISELYHGFICEALMDDIWFPAIVKVVESEEGKMLVYAQFENKTEVAYIIPIQTIFLEDKIRVKFLDSQDIIECGWKIESEDLWQIGEYHLFQDYFDKHEYAIVQGTPDNSIQKFEGAILNKSELLFFMKRLGITK